MKKVDAWYCVEAWVGRELNTFEFIDLMLYDVPGKTNYHFSSSGEMTSFRSPSVFVLPAFWNRLFVSQCDTLRICLTTGKHKPSLWVREFNNVKLSVCKKGLCGSLFFDNETRLWVEDDINGVVGIV